MMRDGFQRDYGDEQPCGYSFRPRSCMICSRSESNLNALGFSLIGGHTCEECFEHIEGARNVVTASTHQAIPA